jgi:two-component system, NarL family, sensor histidine kinase BarA
VNGFSDMLLNSATLTEKQQRWAANISTSGKQLLVLINEILDLAKLEAGKMALKAELVEMPAFCDQAAMLFRPQAENKEIELRVQVAQDWPTIRQDLGKLRQIVSNLLSNAVKFTPDGGRITLSASHAGDKLILAVSDTGVGIPPEEQEMIFQKFRQASNPLTREQGGSGLGLSIVRELAKLLGGNVVLHSEVGRGSTFTLTVLARLPLEPMAELESNRVG